MYGYQLVLLWLVSRVSFYVLLDSKVIHLSRDFNAGRMAIRPVVSCSPALQRYLRPSSVPEPNDAYHPAPTMFPDSVAYANRDFNGPRLLARRSRSAHLARDRFLIFLQTLCELPMPLFDEGRVET